MVADPVERLSVDAVRLVRAAAVLGGDGELGQARRLAGLTVHDAAQLCDLLVSERVLASGRPLRFVDAEIRDAIYASIGDAERRVAHARAAAVLGAAGAGPERVAAHLLRTDPDGQSPVVATLREAARIARARGDPAKAVEYLRRALAEPPKPHVHAVLERELVDAELGAGHTTSEYTSGAPAPRPPRLLKRAELIASDREAQTVTEAQDLADLAMEGLRDGSRDAEAVRRLAGRALVVIGPAFLDAHRAMYCADGFAEADRALAAQWLTLEPTAAAAARGLSRLRQGRVDEALEDLRVAACRHGLALCHLERGELELAHGALATGRESDARREVHARGLIRAAGGDLEAALADLMVSGVGALNPAFLGWRADAVAVLLRMDDRHLAARLAREELELALAFGGRRALGISLRVSALVTASRQQLEESVDVLRGSGAVLELARSLVELGASIRRAGERKAARVPLREALEITGRLGAAQLATRAAEELVASGARRPKRDLSGADSLTPSEQRVAELAGQGLTNREIAQTLVVTVRTVTTHLTHIYQKLEIERRDQLAGVLGIVGPAFRVTEPQQPSKTAHVMQAPIEPRQVAARSEPVPILNVDGARATLAAGDLESVIEYCASAARQATGDRLSRATERSLLAAALFHSGRLGEADATAAAAIDTLGGGAPPALLAELETVRACVSLLYAPSAYDLEARMPRLRLLAVAAGLPGRSLGLVDALWRWWRATPGEDPGLLIARECEAGGFSGGNAALDDPATFLAISALVFMDQDARARRMLADVSADASRRGSVLGEAAALGWAAQLALRSGDVATAELDAREAVELCRRHRLRGLELQFGSVQASALIARGLPSEAEDATASLSHDGLEGTVPFACAMLARGRLEAAQGRPQVAIVDLRAAGRASEGSCADNPNVVPWRSALALVMVAAGGASPESSDLVREELALARCHRQGRAIGVALRARATLESGETRVSTLREAVAQLEGSPARLEHAETLVDLARALSEQSFDDPARDAQREALAMALNCGVAPLAALAIDATNRRP